MIEIVLAAYAITIVGGVLLQAAGVQWCQESMSLITTHLNLDMVMTGIYHNIKIDMGELNENSLCRNVCWFNSSRTS